ncbi:ACBP-domain-containing protein [Schizophyllum commune H4-8]|nr:ACBP-domain-containing protein [Schizophyllum commune H4-8]KAI5894220.1 ACBP-domain-containing protein [Schizophyllum commune H4-8]
MSSRELIDAQFDRAVEIVQSLPKTGPIQTDYEEKLTMYSLYKQATVGNVKSPRPGIWDMLGRAKWDAWNKQKDLTPLEAKWLYVDALLKVLRKYGDKTAATNYVKELESFGSGSGTRIMNASRSRGSSSSGSTASNKPTPISYPYPNHPLSPNRAPAPGESSSEEEPSDEDDDYAHEEEESRHSVPALSVVTQLNNIPNLRSRPPSSAPSPRYYHPRAGQVPATQPQPAFETPSAFADPSPPPQLQSSNANPNAYPHQNVYPASAPSRAFTNYSAGVHRLAGAYDPARPPSRASLESAVANVQAHLAALSERLEVMEHLQVPASRSPAVFSGSGSNGRRTYDLDDMGLWSLVLRPLADGAERVKEFFARDDTRSPARVIVRRLCLDASFLLCVVMLVRSIWRRSGTRRREVVAALVALWKALLGRQERVMVSRGV